ncbi:hypothetical protein WDW89_18900 [Deltaproteobacteria bacterium TL4]
MKPIVQIKDSIATKLLALVFSIYFVITLTLTILHMVVEYSKTKENIRAELQMFQKTFEPTIADFIWSINESQLQSALEGMINIPSLIGIEVLDDEDHQVGVIGTIISSGGNYVTFNADRKPEPLGEKTMFADIFGYSFPLKYRYQGEDVEVGKATLYSSSKVILDRVQSGFILIIINAVIKTVALWIIFLTISRRLLARPLSILAWSANQINLDNLEDIEVKIKTKGRNELKIVEEAFNNMIKKLSISRKELAVIQQNLEATVKRRTDELEQQKVLLQKTLRAQEEVSQHLIDKTYELNDSQQDLEQQNTVLITSNRKLTELDQNKEQLLKRLSTIYETHFTTLLDILDDLLHSEKEDWKKDVRKAAREAHNMAETIRPFSSLYHSEKAIKNKRVLLAETDKKQQIVAKMALGGTGVQLDIVSSYDEGLKCLEEHTYDVICSDAELIELTSYALKHQPKVKTVFMTSDDASSYLKVLREHPHISNIVSRNDEDRTFTLKNIIITVSKMINEDLFGLEKYLSWGVEVQSQPILGSEERRELNLDMVDYFEQLGVRRPILRKCSMVAEELLMNAIYDAPVDSRGHALYNHLPRTVAIELKKEEQGIFRYACDGVLLAVSVEDPFGAFHRTTILAYLESCYKGEAGSLNTNKGGAGRGLFQIIETAELVVFNVKSSIRTEVIAIFNIDPDKPKSTKKTSFHYFCG